MSTVQETIADVKEFAGRYGQLASDNILKYPEVLEIINYYEAEISSLQGKIGGLTKQANKTVAGKGAKKSGKQ